MPRRPSCARTARCCANSRNDRLDRESAALAIHDRQLAEHGGIAGVRDLARLESALARPQQLHADGNPEPDLADLAASLAYGIARNHPSMNGNQRTAHVCYRVFLALNGTERFAADEDKYVAMIALAEGRLAQADFAAWLREHLRSGASRPVNEPRPRRLR